MVDILQREAIFLWYFFSIQFEQIVGYWAIGIAIGSLISVFGKERINNAVESLHKRKLGVLGVIPACVLGIISPLCMYGTVPIAASFSQKGVKDDWLAAFMMGSILLNPQLIFYSAALGPTVLTVRIVSCFFCGIVAGLLIYFFYKRKDKPFFNFAGFSDSHAKTIPGETPHCDVPTRDTDTNLFLRLLKNIWRNVKITGPYFLVGVLLSAMFQRYVPDDVIVRFFGSNRAFGVLMAASIGVPMYVCGGGTIPLLQQWLASGMSLGSATAFMITGPATKITNLGALKIVLGIRRFVLYIMFSIVFAFLTGLLVNLLFSDIF